ncbi:MAG: hypothetical protein J1F12_05445 [Muribaculaceae bacterium]|nr:hypothetical protein [Muribaculaceae bacterium]
MYKNLGYLKNYLLGKAYILLENIGLLRYKGINNLNNDNNEILVSLTSYGRRVGKLAPYAIISILRQNIKPNKIIVNLDKKKWNDNNIPQKLKKLQKFGVTINYTEDIRSYTKLVPIWEMNKNNIIITIDDDKIYSKNLIKELLKSYKNNPHNISAIRTSKKLYKDIKIGNKYYNIRTNHLMGTGGVLYPPNSLDNNVINKDVFLKECPTDDDIWFFFMGLFNGYDTIEVSGTNKMTTYTPDLLYQKFHKGSSLYGMLKIKDAIQNIFNYYNIKIEDIKIPSFQNRVKRTN